MIPATHARGGSPPPLRVLHCNLSGGGIGTYGVHYASGLSEVEGVDALSVLSAALESSSLAQRALPAIRHVHVRTVTLAEKLRAVARVRSLAASFRPHVVHDSAGSSLSLGPLLWPLLARIAPLVVTVHDPRPHTGMGTRWTQRLTRLALRRAADAFVVHGAHCRALLEERGVPPARVHEQVHGPLSLFDGGAFPDVRREEGTVLFFGALRPHKGLELLPRVAERVRERVPGARFVVAGSSRLSRELERSGWRRSLSACLAEMRALPHFEVHEGFVPDERVELLFRRAAVTVLPYQEVTQSGVAMIALPLGSVVVATRVGGLPEVIEDGVTGVVCEPDGEAIADALAETLANGERRRRLAEAGRRAVATRYAWPCLVARNLDLYRRAARGIQ